MLDPGGIPRRRLLGGAALAALWAALPARARVLGGPPTIPGPPLAFHSPRVRPYVEPLPIPPRLPAAGMLQMAPATHRFHRDYAPSPTWSYGGQTYLGPTLEAQAGSQPVIEFVNALGAHPFAANIDTTIEGAEAGDAQQPRVSVHLHGAPNEPLYDGNPMLRFAPGQSFRYRFTMPREAAGLWYHDHAMGMTRLNVYAGLAGQFWVRDDWDTGRADNPLGLPAGEYELPLTIQDKLFHRDGTHSYYETILTKPDQWQGGFCGDVVCVNGAAWPNADVARGLYRLRMLNASATTNYLLSFSNGMRFWLIGSDGGLFDAPVAVDEVQIDPGSRLDVLVDFGALATGTRVQLHNRMQLPFLNQVTSQHLVPQVMQFTVGSARGFAGTVPSRLRGGPSQPPLLPPLSTPARRRTITFQSTPQAHTPFIYLTINNLLYSSGDIEMPQQGSVEQWDIVNLGPGMSHVLHVHLVQFRVLSRSYFDVDAYRRANPRPPVGQRWSADAQRYALPQSLLPPSAGETGMRDTVFLPARTITRLLIRFPTAAELGFDPDAPFTNPFNGETLQGYVMHCHLIDHEDHEMMLRYRIMAPGADAPPVLPMCSSRPPA